MLTLAELQARVAALEVERGSSHPVVNPAPGETQREPALWLDRVETKLDGVNSRVRSLEETLAEVKDLLIQALDGR